MNCFLSDLQIYQGDDKEIKITFVDDQGNPFDISDWKVYFGVRRSLVGEDDFKEVIEVHTDPQSGISSITIPASASADFPVGVSVAGVRVQTDSSKIETILITKFNVLRAVPSI